MNKDFVFGRLVAIKHGIKRSLLKKGKPMIDRKHQKIVFSFFMSLLMSCIMSLIISISNVGLVSNILAIWPKAWAFAFVVAFPTII